MNGIDENGIDSLPVHNSLRAQEGNYLWAENALAPPSVCE